MIVPPLTEAGTPVDLGSRYDGSRGAGLISASDPCLSFTRGWGPDCVPCGWRNSMNEHNFFEVVTVSVHVPFICGGSGLKEGRRRPNGATSLKDFLP